MAFSGSISFGDLTVEVCDDGPYSPDVASDCINRLVETFRICHGVTQAE